MAKTDQEQWEWILKNCTGKKKMKEIDLSELNFEDKAGILAKLELSSNHMLNFLLFPKNKKLNK